MKNFTCFIIIIALLMSRPVFLVSQVAINTDNSLPDNSAMLDINSSSKGLLIPRMTTIQRTSISSPAEGLLVFDTDMGAFYYYHSDSWIILLNASGGWSLSGNSLTGTELFGSTNNQPVTIYSNNLERMRIMETGNVGIGMTVPLWFLDVAGSMNLAQDSSYRIDGYPVVSTKGTGNTMIGINAGQVNTGTCNTATGFYALYNNTTGYYNTANGCQSMFSNTLGNYNAVNGFMALFSNTEGNCNTANGYSALSANTTGSFNTAIGTLTLASNTTGKQNTANGSYALYLNTGSNNTAMGDSALYNNNANANTAFGSNALVANTTGNNNTAIGYQSDVASGGLVNCTAIGNGAVASSDNEMRLGNAGVSSLYCMGAYNGIVGSTNRDVYVDSTGKIGYVSSSARYKNNIEDIHNVDWLYRLRPVNFTYTTDKNSVKQYGLIAEEVEKVKPEFVSYNKNGNPETVSYSALIAPLLKAVQELKAENVALKTEKDAIKARLDALEAMVKEQ